MKEAKTFGFQWHITNLCNLRCKHCYQTDFSRKEDLDTFTLIEIARKISASLSDAVISINITGGEPFFRKDLFDIINYLEGVNNVDEISIITNGIALAPHLIEQTNKFSKLKKIKISIEAADAAYNDYIRGRGSFDKIIKNFELLREISNKEKIIMFTIGSYNYKNLKGMLNFARDIAADGVIIERFVPIGKGKQIRDYFLRNYQWLEVVKAIIKYSEIEMEPEELLPYKAFYISFRGTEEIKGALCNLGGDTMALMPNGDVYPCRRLPIKIGNILEADFKDILEKLIKFRQKIENNIKGRCKECKIDDCIGCRAVVYALTDDLFEEDFQCYYYSLKRLVCKIER